MIRVLYDKSCNRVTVCGHAGSGEYGHDLVCAAASGLTGALAKWAEEAVDNGDAGDCVVQLDRPGSAVIELELRDDQCRAAAGMDAIVTGFRFLAERYHDHISVDVVTDSPPKRQKKA